MKHKLSELRGDFESISDHEDDNISTVSQPTSSSNASTTAFKRRERVKKAADAEDVILAGIEQRSQQMMLMQKEVLEKYKPGPDREREAFVDWVKSVILDLNHDIWRKCQREVSQILYKYIGENDDL